MKKTILFVAIVAVFGLKGYGQFSFGVAPGLSTNSAYFGFKAGKVVPYIGFQFANIGVNLEETGEEWDYDIDEVVDYSYDMKVSGNLYVPNIGIKFFAIENNNLKAYFNLSVAKPFLSAKVTDDGDEVTEVSDLVKEIKLIGGEFGFGVEYFFDDNFSMGGEFGIRYMGGKYSDTTTDTFYNPDLGDDQETEITNTFKAHVSPTYAKISLNFYFGGGSSE